jgi:hypothetical protein
VKEEFLTRVGELTGEELSEQLPVNVALNRATAART